MIIKVGVGIYWVWYRNDILCQDTCHGQCLFLVTLELFICASNLLGKTAEGVRLTSGKLPPAIRSHLVSFASQPGYIQDLYTLANKGRNQAVFNPRHSDSV